MWYNKPMLKYIYITIFVRKAKCKICSKTADVFLKYNRQSGTLNLAIFKKCFDKLRTGFARVIFKNSPQKDLSQ